MSEFRPNSFPKDFALEGGENGQQRGHCTTRRSGQVERLGQRHEADAEMLQFLQSREQVGYRSSPAVQTPHHNNVDLSSPCRFQQFLPTLPLCCSRADFFHLHGDGPAATPQQRRSLFAVPLPAVPPDVAFVLRQSRLLSPAWRWPSRHTTTTSISLRRAA